MKRLFLSFVIVLFVIGSGAQAATFESARQAVDNMRVGWNLGNTLDSNSGDTLNMWIEHWTDRSPSAYETAWGQKVATPELIAMFKKAGFNAIRVPVTWYPHLEAKFAFSTYANSYWYPSQASSCRSMLRGKACVSSTARKSCLNNPGIRSHINNPHYKPNTRPL